MSQTGTYQFFSSTGSRSFAIQTTLPVPISTFKAPKPSKADSLVRIINSVFGQTKLSVWFGRSFFIAFSGKDIGYSSRGDNKTAAYKGADIQNLSEKDISQYNGKDYSRVIVYTDFSRRRHAVGVGKGDLSEASEDAYEHEEEKLPRSGH